VVENSNKFPANFSRFSISVTWGFGSEEDRNNTPVGTNGISKDITVSIIVIITAEQQNSQIFFSEAP
jgi:hypothetical protein